MSRPADCGSGELRHLSQLFFSIQKDYYIDPIIEDYYIDILKAYFMDGSIRDLTSSLHKGSPSTIYFLLVNFKFFSRQF